METTYLQEYVSIADHGSFTAAAADLHLTQSTLSKHVAALEREFGADLFMRGSGGVRLTRAGQLLYTQATQMNRLVEESRRMVKAAADAAEPVGGSGEGSHRGSAIPYSARGNADVRCKCRVCVERYGLTAREAGALALYLEERGLAVIEAELGATRDEVAVLLGNAYRKLGVGGKQEALDVVHSVSE